MFVIYLYFRRNKEEEIQEKEEQEVSAETLLHISFLHKTMN